MISLFSVGLSFLLPYNSIFAISEFSIRGKSIILGINTGFIAANNLFLWPVKKGHFNRKCSEDSISEPQRHMSVGVSLNLSNLPLTYMLCF